jgi:hypothetical protein
MHNAADALALSAAMTADRQAAFEESTLRCIRLLYSFDRRLAHAALRGLRHRNPDAAPRWPAFPVTYALAFRLGGLDVAETLAALRRKARFAVDRAADEVPNYDAP